MSNNKRKNNPQVINKINQIYINIDGSHYEQTLYSCINIENTKNIFDPGRISNEASNQTTPMPTPTNNNIPIDLKSKTNLIRNKIDRQHHVNVDKDDNPLNPKYNAYLKRESLIRDFNMRINTFVYNAEENFRRIITKPNTNDNLISQGRMFDTIKQSSIRTKTERGDFKRTIYNKHPHYKQFLSSIKKLTTQQNRNKKYAKKSNTDNGNTNDLSSTYLKPRIKNTMDFSKQMPRKQFNKINRERNTDFSYPIRHNSFSQVDFQTKLILGKSRGHLCTEVSMEHGTKYYQHMHRGNQLNQDIKKLNKVAKRIFLLSSQ